MAPATKQVRLPFDKMTEANLRPFAKKFEKWGIKISEIKSANVGKRESGFLLKDALFIFEDGQRMLIRVKSDGTVFQVKLNNKVLPVKSVDNVDKAVIEMVDYVQANAKAYERAKIQREKRRKIVPDVPAVTTSRREKIFKVQNELRELSASNAELEQQQAEASSQAQAKQAEMVKAESELAAEKEKTAKLENELASLMKG